MKSKFNWTVLAVVIMLGLMVGSAPAAIVVIAKTNDPAPEAGTSFVGGFTFGRAMLNDLGQVAFSAQLQGAPINTGNDWGLFRGDGTTLVEISREGDLAPDGDGTFGVQFQPAINDVGQVAFKSGMNGTANNDGVFYGTGGALTQVVRKNQAAPDSNGVYSQILSPMFNDAGQAAFVSSLTGTSRGSLAVRGGSQISRDCRHAAVGGARRASLRSTRLWDTM